MITILYTIIIKFLHFFDIPSKAINGLWLMSKVFSLIDGDIISFNTDFDNLYFVEDKIDLNMVRIGNKLGSNVNLVEIINNKHKIMKCELIIKSVPTVYLFPGKESLSKSFGTTLYLKSQIFKHIMDLANDYMVLKYGIPLLHILYENPKEFNVIFDTLEKKNIYLENKLITDSQKNFYKFYNKKGILFLPIFSQIITVIYEKALYMEKVYQCTSHNE